MNIDIDSDLRLAIANVDRRDACTKKLRDLQETLTSKSHELSVLEYQVALVAEEIRRLENPGFFGTISAILFQSQHEITEKKEQLNEYQLAFADLQRTVIACDKEIQGVKGELDEFGDCDEAVEALLDKKAESALAAGGEETEKLQDAVDGFAFWKHQTGLIGRAVEAGEFAVKRTKSLMDSMNRASKSRIHVAHAPIVGAAWNTIKDQGTRPHASRAREGLTKLYESAAKIDLGGGTHAELEIARLLPELDTIAEELTENSVAMFTMDASNIFPVENVVRDMVGNLKELHNVTRQHMTDFDAVRRRILLDGI